ncbi:MAG: MoxR-like ATPase [Alphaproteobacteria bacterium]|jgi:MoxR-like ATPase|nr:MoxR-like ATPase [Alphaproteobacteria bacterium]
MTVTEKSNLEAVYDATQAVAWEINKVIVGQDWLIQRLLIGLFSQIPYSFKRGDDERMGYGHVLLEGVPGLAKTLTVMTLANVLSATFQRIQFTPDLLPADITGTRVFDTAANGFRIEKGPIFANLILADEINRATQKTQSALLEAMQERQVTIGETTFPLAEPFWVLATQNPVEQEGVYALPEAQLDRFALKVNADYPSHSNEAAILGLQLGQTQVSQVMTPAEVIRLRRIIGEGYVSDAIREYIVRIVRTTRPQTEGQALPIVAEMVLHGASPRAAQHLLALARTTAFFQGRDYILPADVKRIAPDALRHRLIRSVRAEAEEITADEIVAEILARVPLP